MKAEDVNPEAFKTYGPVLAAMVGVVLKCARERRNSFDLHSVTALASPHVVAETPRKIKQASCFNEAIYILAWEALNVLTAAKVLVQIEPWERCDKPWQRGGALFQFADGVE